MSDMSQQYRDGYRDGLKRAAELLRSINVLDYGKINLDRLAERVEALEPEKSDE